MWKWLKWSLVAAFLVALAIRGDALPDRNRNLPAAGALSVRTDARRRLLRRRRSQPQLSAFPPNGPYDSGSATRCCRRSRNVCSTHGFVIASQARDSERCFRWRTTACFCRTQEKDQAGLQLFDGTGAPLFDAQLSAPDLRQFRRDSAAGRQLAAIHRRPRSARPGPAEPQSGDRLGPLRPRAARPGRALVQPASVAARRQHACHPDREIPPLAGRTHGDAAGKIAANRVRLGARLSERTADDAGAAADRRALSELGAACRRSRASAKSMVWATVSPHGMGAISTKSTASSRRRLPPTTSTEQGAGVQAGASLMIAQRAPSYFLHHGYAELERMTDSYLRLLATAASFRPRCATPRSPPMSN